MNERIEIISSGRLYGKSYAVKKEKERLEKLGFTVKVVTPEDVKPNEIHPFWYINLLYGDDAWRWRA